MSSTIKLYEHNQKAYDALLDMLGERDRACVIKPTGTGKFIIIAKMVQDNPDKRFLLLGTNDYMFNDQMANLAEIAPGFTPENLQFMTYSAAMMAARRGEEISGYDVVVADEFHHCGAEEWGKGVTHILDANESAKVVGFSATPIRYSDGGRNMADEMLPDEYRQKIRNQKKKPNNKSRPVICLETGERFESISLVSRMLGISKSNVFHAMKNGSAVHGIHFYYGDELKPDDSFFKPKRRRKVRCTETGVVYESIKDAAERTKISPNGIGSAASGMAGGYHWEYADD